MAHYGIEFGVECIRLLITAFYFVLDLKNIRPTCEYTLHLTIVGWIEVTLEYGNCWYAGSANVYLNNVLINSADPKSLNVITFSVAVGDQLHIKDEGRVAVITIIRLEICTGGSKHVFNFYNCFL